MSLLSTGKILLLSPTFRHVLTLVGVVFVLATAVISIKPDPFLKFGYLGVFVYNMVGSGLLLIPLVSHKLNLFWLILFSALGNISNTSVNYFIGSKSSSVVSRVPYAGKMRALLQHFGLLGVYILAILPLPIDANGLFSGYMGVKYRWYILINFLGKVTVFLLVGLGVLSLSSLVHHS